MPPAAPSFYVTPTQRLGLRSVLPAFVIALVSLTAVRYALSHTHHDRLDTAADGTDDPNQVDTIYVGGAHEAPTATRPVAGYNPVHPFKVVRLPRSGDGTGQIPDTPAGHLLFRWLAAFNDKDPNAAAGALPVRGIPAAAQAGAAQIALRRQTGGFSLLSAREIAPGLLVFRLQDQTPKAGEALGSLQLNPLTSPATIASFSLRSIP